jgi:RNA polymerase sigma-70 factor, ECF subfamily
MTVGRQSGGATRFMAMTDAASRVHRNAANVSTGKQTSQRQQRAPDRETFRTETLALFGSVFRVARRLTKTTVDAEDLTQETYVRALGAVGSFRLGTNLKSWLFTILRNINRNRTRDRAREVVVVDSKVMEHFDGAGASSDTPEAQLLRNAESRDLRAAVDALSPALRQTVWLRDVEELSYAEIARRLNIPIGTVMSRLSRARALLYRRMTDGANAGREGGTTK